MGPKIWQQYLFKTTLIITVFVLGILCFLTGLIDCIEGSSRLAKSSNLSPILLMILRLPSLTYKILPFVLLFSTLISISVIKKRSEWIVLRTCGLSLKQISMPFVINALLFGIIGILVLNPISIWSSYRIESTALTLFSSVFTKKSPLFWISQKLGNEDLLIGGYLKYPTLNEFENVNLVYLNQDQSLNHWVYAKSAILTKNQWHFYQPLSSNFETGEHRAIKNFSIKSNTTPEFTKLRDLDPSKTSLFTFPSKIASAELFPELKNTLQMNFYGLLTFPIFLITMTLTALVISFHYSRSVSYFLFFVRGISLGFSIYVLFSLAYSLGKATYLSPMTANFLPIFISSILISFSFYVNDRKR